MMTTNSLFLRIITKLAINGTAPLTKGFTTEVCQLNAKHPFQLDLLIMNVSWFRFQRLDIVHLSVVLSEVLTKLLILIALATRETHVGGLLPGGMRWN